MKLGARSWLTGWTYAEKLVVRLTRKHGLRGLGPALQEEVEDQGVEIERTLLGAPVVTFDGGVRVEPSGASPAEVISRR